MEPLKVLAAARRETLAVTVSLVMVLLGTLSAFLGHGNPTLARFLVAGSFGVLMGQIVWLVAKHHVVERRLAHALWFQQQLLERIPIPVFYKDKDCVYLGCNRSFQEFIERDRGQIIGRTVHEAAPPELAQRYEAADLHLLAQPGVQVYEADVVRGEVERHVVFHKSTFEQRDGQVGGIIGAILDVTERREAQEHSEALARELQVLLDTLPLGIIKLVDRRIAWANRAMEELSGYASGELTGQSTRMLYTSEARYQAQGRQIYATLATGAIFRGDEEMVRRDGERRWIELSGLALVPADPAGGSFWAIADITSRRATEQTLRESEERFTKAFNQSAVAMTITSLADGRYLEANDKFLSLVECARHEVIGRLAAELGIRMDPHQGHLDLAALEAQGSAQGLELSFRTRSGTLRCVLWSGEKVLINQQPCMLATATDISDYKLALAALRAADDSITELQGLIPICSHCKKIRNDGGFWQQVEQYITAHSEALFSHGICPDCAPLFFPNATRSKLRGADAADASAEDRNPLPPKVLVVDDAPAQIRTLIEILRESCTVLVATDGPGALQVVKQESPDLILLDVVMPGMDGHEVCRRLKEDPLTRGIPVIFATLQHEEEQEIAGFALGAVDFVTKPFSLPRVRARVRTHLELKRHRDELERRSMQDSLTGVPNRRAFDESLDLLWRQAIRQGTQVSLFILDVDDFKAFNDHYGHRTGDDCLRRVASALKGVKRRPSDLIFRFGGKAFVCALPGTDRAEARLLAEEMRQAVEALAVPHAKGSAFDLVTASLGVASAKPQIGDPVTSLVESAEQALDRAKKGGRNRVEC